MDLFFDDFVNGLVHQVQENVVPKLERVAAAATASGTGRSTAPVTNDDDNEQQKHQGNSYSINGSHRDDDYGGSGRGSQQRQNEHARNNAGDTSAMTTTTTTTRRRSRRPRPRPRPTPPTNTTDLVYVTDRLLISSRPAVASVPTYLDVGRDDDVHGSFYSYFCGGNGDGGGGVDGEDGSSSISSGDRKTSEVVPPPPPSPEAGTEYGHDLVASPYGEGDAAVGSAAPVTGDMSHEGDNGGDNDDQNPQDGTGSVENDGGDRDEGNDDANSDSSIPADATNGEVAGREGMPGGFTIDDDNMTGDGRKDESIDVNVIPSNSSNTALVVENAHEPRASDGNINGDGSALDRNEQAITAPSGKADSNEPQKSTIQNSVTHKASSEMPEEKLVSMTDEHGHEPRGGNEQKQQQQPKYLPSQKQQQIYTRNGRIINSPATIVDFLDRYHGRYRHMAFSLMNDKPDDRTLRVFRRQIVQLGWWSPCIERTETPSITKIFKVCYAIHAYLQLDPLNVALVYCSNGKTRTSIAVGCYLKYAGMVERSIDGFEYVLKKRGVSNPRESALKQIPPSLRLFFHQFDEVLEYGRFLNQKPLLLRAVALQGVPVEDQPCLDIWDSSQRHVYSSHPDMWKDDIELHRNMAKCHNSGGGGSGGSISNSNGSNLKRRSQWVDEEGFYQANVILDGDFVLLCRFGGDFAPETNIHDPTKILFRYSNTTGFLSGGYPYELDCQNIDLTRRYSDQFDDEDFLVTLLFEADWEQLENCSNEKSNELQSSISRHLGMSSKACRDQFWKRHEDEACDEGLRVIFESHSARPTEIDLVAFKRYHHQRKFDQCSDNLILLALQLTNIDFNNALHLLTESPVLSWWEDNNTSDYVHELGDDETEQTEDNRDDWHKDDDVEVTLRTINDRAVEDVMNILNEVDDDINKNLHPADLDFYEQLDRKREFAGLRKKEEGSDHALDSQSSSARDTGWMVPSLFYPRQGDITGKVMPINRASSPDFPASIQAVLKRTPRMPYIKRSKQNLLSPPSKRIRTSPCVPDAGHTVPRYDPILASVVEAHSQLRHTGVSIDGLKQLAVDSRNWTGVPRPEEGTSMVSQEHDTECAILDGSKVSSTNNEPTSMNREAKEKKEAEWKNNQKIEAEQKKKSEEEKRLAQAEGKVEESAAATGEKEQKQDDIPLEKDPRFAKYFKMLKLGMPREQVLHALKRDDHDPSILDLDPTKSLKSQERKAETGDDDLPLNKDEKYSKYFKMLKLGMPREQVLHAMKRDDINPFILDLDQNQSLKSQEQQLAKTDDKEEEDGKEPVLKDDPKYSKYFRMLKMSLPMGAVKNAMVRDGLDPTIMDLDHNKSVKTQVGNNIEEERDNGIPLKDDPEYTKYFKMEKMGLPRDAVRNALVRDGLDPAIIDLDPNKSVAFQLKKKNTTTGRLVSPTKPVRKKKVRRKKIYWNPIDPKRLNEDSMWNIVRDAVSMDKLKYDEKEFEELFTESADQSQKKKAKPEKEKKKLVQAIDPKRSMNGGIVLSRIKVEHEKIADYVDRMDHAKFDITMLKALKEYLPDPDERRSLVGYMKKGEKSEDERKTLFADLSETEKYMVTMMEVEEAAQKLDAMMFRSVFKSRCEDITAATKTLNLACDELRSSEKLRKLMAVILTVVNQINTGGEGKAAMGFTLDALLKLNEAKAFDRKTSVLHYVVKLVKKNDESLLTFENDLSHIIPAESVLLDAVIGDVKSMQEELTGVLPIVQKDADRLEQKGEIRKMTLAELAEQRTMVVGNHFNRVEHLTGRTPMERFTLTAKVACESAEQSITEVQRKYSKLLNYFGEDENMATGDFFGILRRFMAEFKKAIEQVEKIERARAKEKKRAAARASKDANKSKGKGLKSRPGVQQSTGGVAALAAEAAKKKNDSKLVDTKTNEGPVTMGSVAAMAAAAAKARNDSKIGAKANKGPVSMGSVAAMAAAAAKAKNDSKTGTKANKGPVSMGSVAAMAAAAAAKKQKDAETETDVRAPATMGSVAAMAAAAATKKQKDAETETDVESPATMGSVAAMAAAAATKKQKDAEAETDVKAPVTMGSVAAMAAAAATMKQKDAEIETDVESPATMGISATMAAAEASKKRRDTELEPDRDTVTMGNVTAMVAATATEKKVDPSLEIKSEIVESVSETGAATAAQKQVVDRNAAEGPSVASMVTVSAQEKEEKTDMGVSSSETDRNHAVVVDQPDTSKSAGEIGVGSEDTAELPDAELNIGAAAFSSKALAYRKQKEQKEKEDKSKNTGGSKFLSSLSSYRKNMGTSNTKATSEQKTGADVKAIRNQSTTSLNDDNGGVLTRDDTNARLFPDADDENFRVQTRGDAGSQPSFDSKGTEADYPGMDAAAATTNDKSQSISTGSLSAPINPTLVDEKPSMKPSVETPTATPLSGTSETVGDLVDNKETASVTVDNSSNPVSLDSFLERQQSHEIRSEVLRQNFDDTSVAIMAENLENHYLSSPSNEDAWNESVGITDYMGWAEGLRRESDTDSVAAFEESRNLDYNYDNDDESTIASAYYDTDDLSVASSVMTPRGQPAHFSFDGLNSTSTFTEPTDFFHESFEGQPESQPSVTAKVAASILFNDSDSESAAGQQGTANVGGHFAANLYDSGYQNQGPIDMSLAFEQSSGMDAGFDDGLGFVGVEDAGLGGFGMTSTLDPTGWQGYGVDHNSLSVDPGLPSFGGSYPSINEDSNPKDGEESKKRSEATTPKSWFQWAKGAN